MHIILLALAIAAATPKHPPVIERCKPACAAGQRCLGNICTAEAKRSEIKPRETKPAPAPK